MKILIEFTSNVSNRAMIIDIFDKHNVFDKCDNYKCRYKLINGDEIIIVSSKLLDGRRADVAIGEHAEYLTAHSTQSKRVWTYEDLDRYLQEVKANA